MDWSSGGRLNFADSVRLLLVFTPAVSPEMVKEGLVVAGCPIDSFKKKTRPIAK